MIENTPSADQAAAAWSALRDWLSQDEQGKALVLRFEENPQGEAAALKQWLQTRAVQAPPQLATYVTGGRIDNLVNVAQAGTISIAHASTVVLQRIVMPAQPAAPFQLPADVTFFTGRRQEMADLSSLLQQGSTADDPPTLALVTGMAGVGKSALAIHIAHTHKAIYPDAQLYADLRDPDGKPVENSAVLAGFLRALGIEDRFIPASPPERAGLFRSLLAEKKALVLLDNAHDEAQVRPLLPAGGSCAVIITSRASLAALEGANPCRLDVLAENEAIELLGKLAGPARVQAEPAPARQIVTLCEGLPLAVRIAGGKLRDKQHWSLAGYAAQLGDEKSRLQQLQLGDLQLRASFSLSYRDLTPVDAHALRLLGMLPGADFAPHTAATLLDLDPNQSLATIERLVDMQFLEPATGERYRFQHLVRLFAIEELKQVEPPPSLASARLRLIHYYLRVSGIMTRWLDPDSRQREAQSLAAQIGKPVPAAAAALLGNALTWFEEELPGLVAVIYWSYYAEDDETVWRMAAHMVDFAQIRAHRQEWEQILLLALMASRRTKYPPAEALALTNLGIFYRTTGRLKEAEDILKRALAIDEDLGNRENAANNYNNLGTVYLTLGQAKPAADMFNQALAIDTQLGRKKGLANDFGNLGNLYGALHDFQRAEDYYKKALSLETELDHKEGMANSYNNLGALYGMQDRIDDAEPMFQAGLAIETELGRKEGLAANYGNIGLIHLSRNELDAAEDKFKQALAIDDELGLREGMATNLNNLGIVFQTRGDLDKAEDMYQRSLAIEDQLGRQIGIADSCYSLALLYENRGKTQAAREMYARALDVYTAIGAAADADRIRERLNNLPKPAVGE